MRFTTSSPSRWILGNRESGVGSREAEGSPTTNSRPPTPYNVGVKRFLAVLLLVVACRNERPLPPVAPSPDQNTPQDGGTVVRRLDFDITTLNPVMAQSDLDRRVDFYLFTPMVHLDIDLQPIPGLAQKWEISSDGKQYTFHLNPAATFSDGSPVRAGDVLFTLKKIVDPTTEAPQIAGGFENLD